MNDSIADAADLSKDVKDIRDELNVLRTIADFQLTVQSRLAGDSTRKDDLSAQYVLTDIKELEKVAEKIQEGVCQVLTLLSCFAGVNLEVIGYHHPDA